MRWIKGINDILNMDEVVKIEIMRERDYNPYDYCPNRPNEEIVIVVLIKEEVESGDFCDKSWDDITNKIMECVDDEDKLIPLVILHRNKHYVYNILRDNMEIMNEVAEGIIKHREHYKQRTILKEKF
jgi:hypothetical protein